jgi:hypothetical protein
MLLFSFLWPFWIRILNSEVRIPLIILPPRCLLSIQHPPLSYDQIEPAVLAGQPVASPWTDDSASCDLDCVSRVLLVLAAHVILAS